MRKATAMILATLLFASLFLFFPAASRADTDRCFDEYQTCWTRAVDSGSGKFKMTLMLTLCDIVFGLCLIKNASPQ